MATNHTTNYQLCQWEAADQVLRADFNEDNQKIDAAMKGIQDTVPVILFGTYTVTYDDGVVYFDGTSDTDFVMDDSFTIYVIEVEDDYEVNTVSGSRLESRYSGGTMEVFAVLDGDGYATELYVLVTEMPAD